MYTGAQNYSPSFGCCVTSLLTGRGKKGHRYYHSVEWMDQVCSFLQWDKKCHPTAFFFFFSAQRWHKSWMPGRNIHLQGGKKPALHSSVIGTDCVVAGWNSVMLLLLQHRDVSVPDCADSQSRKHDTQTQCTVTLFLSPSNLGKCLVSFSCLWLT